MSVTVSSQSQVQSLGAAVLPALKPKRRPSAYGRRWVALLATSDLTMFLLSAYLAVQVVSGGRYAFGPTSGIGLSTIAYATLWFLIFERLGLYRRSFALSMRDELYYTSAALGLGALPQFVLFTIVPSVSSSRLVLLVSLVFAVVAVGGARAVLHVLHARVAAASPPRIALVGHRERLDAALASLNFSEGTKLLTLAEPDVETTLVDVDLGRYAELQNVAWLRQARAWGCDTILLTEVLPPHVLPHLLEITARDRITLAFAPPRLCAHAYDYSLRTDGHQALIVPKRLRACRPEAQVAKRTLDLVLGTIGLILVSPIMLLAALAVLIEDGRPILFQQERVGLNGRPFRVLKFRSMRVDAEAKTGATFVRADDDRTTRVGAFLRRTSLDELPQLFNVLRGEMSLVGPRPERPVFVEQFRRQLPRYDERHLVRPGITGWSHIHMKRVVDVSDISERLSYDLFYVENWSVFMDVSIIVKTAVEVLFHKAA